MSLVTMKELLSHAQEDGYGVGAFSTADMQMVMGIIRAAEELHAPVILQIAQARLPDSPLHLLGPMMVSAAQNARVPVAVHLDHGEDIRVLQRALDIGFTSVMLDASRCSISENIKRTIEAMRLAEQYGATVEAEVGQLGIGEDGISNGKVCRSDPDEVKMLYEHTGVDAIALSIGNAHGLYQAEPKLDFDCLSAAHTAVPVPLVLHGGSGISGDDFRRCICGGIHKLNIATASFRASEMAARKYVSSGMQDYFRLSRAMANGVCASVCRHIEWFGSAGKATADRLNNR